MPTEAVAPDPIPIRGIDGAAPAREGRNLDHFWLRIEPFDDAAIGRHLQACGVDAGGEGPSSYLQDPEHKTIELKGPAWN